jgi:hypothetical protein
MLIPAANDTANATTATRATFMGDSSCVEAGTTSTATQVFRLVLPEASPSLNTWIQTHWAVKKRHRKRWAMLLLVESRRAGIPKASGKRRLVIERHGRKRLDADNLIGGAKGIIDELRTLGLLLEDHDDALELVARNVPLGRGEAPHTVLLIEDLSASYLPVDPYTLE